jgi:hypothetical protein
MNSNYESQKSIVTLDFSSLQLLMASVIFALAEKTYDEAVHDAHHLISASQRRRKEYKASFGERAEGR